MASTVPARAALLLPASRQHAFLTRLVGCLPRPLYKRLTLALGRRDRIGEDLLRLRIQKILSEAGAHHLTATMNVMMPDLAIRSLEQARHEVDLQRIRQDFFPKATRSDDQRFATLQDFIDELTGAQLSKSVLQAVIKKTEWLERKRLSDLGANLIRYDDACNYLIRTRSILGEPLALYILYGFFKYLTEITVQHLEAIPTLEPEPPMEQFEIPDLSDSNVKRSLDDFLHQVASKLPEQTYETVARSIYLLQSKREGRSNPHHVPFTSTDLQRYLHQLRQALGNMKSEFIDRFQYFAPVITVEALEKVRMIFNRVEIYRMDLSTSDWTNNALTASKRLSNDEEFRHKVFVNNLPLDVTSNELIKAFRSFGNVVATELFKERIPRRFLKLDPPAPPQLPKPFNLDDEGEEIDSEDAIETESLYEDNVVVVDEMRAKTRSTLKKSRLKPKPIPDSRLYAAVYFDDERSVQKALDHSIRIFGVAMEDKIVHDAQCKTIFRQCRTSYPPSALYIGNIPFEVCGYSVETELHKLLCSIQSFPKKKSFIQTDNFNVGRGSLIILFNNHIDALTAYRSLVGRSLRGRPLRIGWMVDSEINSIYERGKKKRLVDSKKQTIFDFGQFN